MSDEERDLVDTAELRSDDHNVFMTSSQTELIRLTEEVIETKAILEESATDEKDFVDEVSD